MGLASWMSGLLNSIAEAELAPRTTGNTTHPIFMAIVSGLSSILHPCRSSGECDGTTSDRRGSGADRNHDAQERPRDARLRAVPSHVRSDSASRAGAILGKRGAGGNGRLGRRLRELSLQL